MTSMNSSLGSLLLLSLLSGGSIGGSRPVASPSPSAGSNPLLLALLLGGGLGSGGASGGLGLDFSSLFGSLSGLLGGSSSSATSVFPDVASLITPNPTPAPTTPTTPTTPTPPPAGDTITLEAAKGSLPAGFDINNPPKVIKYGGHTYNYVSTRRDKPGQGGNVIGFNYKSPTKIKMGLNYLNMTLTRKNPSSSSSSSSLSNSLIEYSVRTGSPLVFDLNGDGKTKTLADTQQFDINNDGQADTINNIDSGDGLLVMDHDGDGVSGEDATEVFGNHTQGNKFDNGFDALKSVAKTVLGDPAVADGKLDAVEIAALESKVNLGMKVGGEFKTLTQLGISSVNLAYNDKIESMDANGNIIAGQSAFVQNGKSKVIHDIFFKIH